MEGHSLRIQLAILMAVLGLATVLRALASPWAGSTLPYTTYMLGTIIIAWATCWQFAMFGMTIGTILGFFLFYSNDYHYTLRALACFWINGGVAVLVTESIRAAQRQAKRVSLDLIEQQQERDRLTKELHDRIADRDLLTKELQKRISELDEADRRKNDFMAMLAHELRNPLAPIQNCTSILSAEVDGETIRWALDTMQRQVQHMVRLVDDLFDVSRSLRGRIDLKKETHDLQTILYRAVETSKPLIESQEHHFIFIPPCHSIYVDVDEVRMAQVVSNLLNNAAKYTAHNGTIELSTELKADQVTIKVTDNGCGIDSDLLVDIFDPFIQADHSLDRSKGGLGIGLALVRSLVEMHNGRVEVASVVGEGSTFSVTLPVSKENSLSVIPVYTKKGHISQKILVVDDNADSASTLATILRLDGHQSQFVFSGAAALEILPKFRPDIILMDIGLPEMDGYEVCQRIRNTPGFTRTFIVALTGYGTPEHREQAFISGFNEHLVKPIQYDVLQSLFDNICGPQKAAS